MNKAVNKVRTKERELDHENLATDRLIEINYKKCSLERSPTK